MGLISEDDIKTRLQSPLNLMNRLRAATEKSSANIVHPGMPVRINDLVKDVDDKLSENSNSIKAKASAILIAAMDELKERIPEIHKPEKLSAIAKDMSNVIQSQNQKGSDDGANQPQIVIYSPQIRHENEFNIINVHD